MSYLAGLVDNYYFEEARKVFEKHSFGSVSDEDNSAYEKIWEVATSNQAKLAANVIFETSLKYLNDNNLIEDTKRNYPDVVHIEMQAIQLHNMQAHLNAFENSQFVKHPEFGNIQSKLKEQIADLQTSIQLLADDKNININVRQDNLTTTLDKLIGQGYGKYFNDTMDKLFKYDDYAKLVYSAFDEKLPSDESKQADYLKSMIDLVPKMTGQAFIEGVKSESLGYLESLAQKIPALSAKGVVGILSRGVVVGIVSDLTYKGSYAFGEWVFTTVFKKAFGKELYEMDWFINFADTAYSTIFQDLTGTELNTVVSFNTMILGNFINPQGQSVTQEDTAVLFGDKDYKDMSFEKTLHIYKALHKAITQSDTADTITSADEMIKSMQALYPLVKELRGKMMIIPQSYKEVNDYYELAIQDNDKALAYRFSLLNLLPMVILDMDYSKYNQHGELELYSQDNPNGMTQEYIKARTEMLGFKLQYSAMDIDYDDKLQVGILPLPVVKGDHIYQDLDSKLTLNIDGVDLATLSNHYNIFGGTDNDNLRGDSLSDNLFGSTGNDTLIGGADTDYLEGGIGFDTYHIKDHDTLFDSDGKGQILFEGKALPKAFIKKQASNNTYFYAVA